MGPAQSNQWLLYAPKRGTRQRLCGEDPTHMRTFKGCRVPRNLTHFMKYYTSYTPHTLLHTLWELPLGTSHQDQSPDRSIGGNGESRNT